MFTVNSVQTSLLLCSLEQMCVYEENVKYIIGDI